jgi:hypothetical protein
MIRTETFHNQVRLKIISKILSISKTLWKLIILNILIKLMKSKYFRKITTEQQLKIKISLMELEL